MDYDKMKRDTEKAFAKPKAGMRFHEMFSAWVYIIARPIGMVVVRTFGGHPANPLKSSIQYKVFPTAEAFRKAYSYDTQPGYTMEYCDDKAFDRMKKERAVTDKEFHQGYLDEVQD
jgi:hypothetical protein